MNTEALSVYLHIHLSSNCSLNSKMMMNERMCKVIKMLQEIIEKFTFLTKSSSWAKNFWNLNCSEIVMKSRWLQIIWKIQSTLDAWNEYLKHNDHKNKIIQQAKRAYFKSQMHELSNALKSIWCFAKWIRIESQLSKKTFSVFITEVKWHWLNDNDVQEKKSRYCKKNSFSHFLRQTSTTLQTHLYSWQCHLTYVSQKMKWDRQSKE